MKFKLQSIILIMFIIIILHTILWNSIIIHSTVTKLKI
nr:MAG TPA: hypothetical protein [Caudoviricetes sp.]